MKRSSHAACAAALLAASAAWAGTWTTAQDPQGNWYISNGPKPWDSGKQNPGTTIPMADEKTAKKTADKLNDAKTEGDKRNEKNNKGDKK